MKKETLSGFSPRRRVMRNAAMNAGLVALLAAVFLWSVAGNALENIRSMIEKHV